MYDPNKSPIYNEISDFLISIGFSEPTDTCKSFRRKIIIPGRVIVVNGRRMEEPNKEANFDITPIGQGAELDNDNNSVKELQGYNIGDNDFWVDSLKDFKFWIEKIVGRTSNLMENQ